MILDERDSATQAGERAHKRGFSIVELLVAVVILAIGVLAMAGTSSVVLRQMTGGKMQTSAAQIAASRMELFNSRKCDGLAGTGTASTPGVTESWTVKAAENGTMVAQVSVTIHGRSAAEVFSTVISCQ